MYPSKITRNLKYDAVILHVEYKIFYVLTRIKNSVRERRINPRSWRAIFDNLSTKRKTRARGKTFPPQKNLG